METITLTTKTLVERKLVVCTVVGSAVFYLLILLFMSVVFHFDLELKWYHSTKTGFFDKIPRMSEKAKKREQLETIVRDTPALYCRLYRHWQYFLVGIPTFTLLIGGILSFYRSVTIETLGLYHFVFSLFTFCLALIATLAVIISNIPFIIRPL